MHYCFLTSGNQENNASFVRLRELGSQMVARGIRVSYVVDDFEANRTRLRLHPDAAVQVVSQFRGLGQFRARRRAIESIRPDYVHILNAAAKSVFSVRALRGPRLVCDWDEWPTQRDFPFFRLMLERYLDRWCRKNAFLRVVASRYMQEQFRKLGSEATYLPYATYLSHHEDGVSPLATPTLIYMGNLWPEFDHDLLLEAARILKGRGKSPRIEVLGDGPERARCESIIREHGLDNVVLAGFLTGDELWRRLRHAHALAFPIRPKSVNLSRCPSKTFAYAQTQRPILACRVGEVAEVLQDNATYVEPDGAAWAEAIDRVMSAPALPDRDYHIEQHNWSERTDRLLDALARAASSAATGV